MPVLALPPQVRSRKTHLNPDKTRYNVYQTKLYFLILFNFTFEVMAEKSGNFLGGFILGTIAGSALGIIFGSKLNKILDQNQTSSPEDESTLPVTSEEIANLTKRGLEQKIAQLNEAIDAVSQELSTESNGKVSFQSPLKSSQIEKL
jgi:hypothetical protein